MLRHMTIRLGSALVAAGLIVGAVQIALRAVNGYWPQWRLALIWEAIGGGWPHWPSYTGAEHAAVWVLAWPLSVAIVGAGLLAWTTGIWIWSAFARG
jgi:hypothetical protein